MSPILLQSTQLLCDELLLQISTNGLKVNDSANGKNQKRIQKTSKSNPHLCARNTCESNVTDGRGMHHFEVIEID